MLTRRSLGKAGLSGHLHIVERIDFGGVTYL